MSLFNLFQRPSRMVFLDDDPLFLDILSLAIPSHWRADLFTQTQQCHDFLEANAKAQKQDAMRQRDIVAKSKAGESLIALVVQYWNQCPDRYDPIELAVFDYGMPGPNGIEAFAQLAQWEGRRALLTGQADEAVAVSAFNAGQIHQFIPKQLSGLRACLIRQLQPLLNSSLPSQQVLWRQSLTEQQLQWLADTSVVAHIQQWLKDKQASDYVVTDVPFGVLMANSAGQVSWLQLESKAHLDDLVDLAGEDLTQADAARVLKGEALVNTELSLALRGLPLRVSPAFSVGAHLLGVSYDLGKDYDLDPGSSYRAWCDRHALNSNCQIWHAEQSANPTV